LRRQRAAARLGKIKVITSVKLGEMLSLIVPLSLLEETIQLLLS
jgi:hypothetical protein